MKKLMLAVMVMTGLCSVAAKRPADKRTSAYEKAVETWAQRTHMTKDEWENLSAAEQKKHKDAYAEAHRKAQAEYAKKLGMSVEEYNKLTPEQKKQKLETLKADKEKSSASAPATVGK